jgi:hypothetical protein
MYPEHDPNDPSDPVALSGVNIAAMLVFLVVSISIAISAYKVAHFLYARLPPNAIVLPNAHN